MTTPPAAALVSRRTLVWSGAALAVATVLAYSRTFSVPFVFDDASSIATNPSLRQLWPLWGPFNPPLMVTVSGRPVVNATLALNHTLGGVNPRGYHAVNLAIHVLAGLALFGCVRRTLARAPLAARHGAAALPLALIAAALWLLHPLQTESVTYVVQRVESLMGLFFLLTLYAFVRAMDAATAAARVRWLAGSVAACLLGMGSKEVMVSAPLLVLLYDRTFVAGTFRSALRERPRYYAALAATWALLAWLALGTGGRSGTAGFSADLSAWDYALTQVHAVAQYLRLSLWPHPLVFDYGTDVVREFSAVVAPGALLLGLGLGTAWAIWRGRPLGFAGAWFFAILAPTSSVVPVATQTMAEHRLYLPLAAIVTTLVLAAHARLGRVVLPLGAGLALLGGALTVQRNETYRSELDLWADTVARRPQNARAHYNLAETQARAQRTAAAIASYQAALHCDPNYAEAYNNLGVLLRLNDRANEAFDCFERAVRIDPDNPVSRHNFGDALAQRGRLDEAVTHFQRCLALQPDRVDTLTNLGGALLALGRPPEAIAALERALRLDPDFAEAHSNLGVALLQQRRNAEAAEHFTAVLRTAPRDPGAHSNLGYLALQASQAAAALTHYRIAAEERPDEPESHYNLGIACIRASQPAEAGRAFEQALRLRPDYAEARRQLALLRGSAPR